MIVQTKCMRAWEKAKGTGIAARYYDKAGAKVSNFWVLSTPINFPLLKELLILGMEKWKVPKSSWPIDFEDSI